MGHISPLFWGDSSGTVGGNSHIIRNIHILVIYYIDMHMIYGLFILYICMGINIIYVSDIYI